MSSKAVLPNILVTGTPGTGKTTTSEEIVEEVKKQLGVTLQHVNIGTLVKERELHDGRDEEFDAFLLNEDKVCDELEPIMAKGGNVVDFHTPDFMPERWFDLILVLRTDNSLLYKRLEDRGYEAKKITENVEAEIMQVVLDEARESYDKNIVIELPSNSIEDMQSNVQRTVEWFKAKLSKK